MVSSSFGSLSHEKIEKKKVSYYVFNAVCRSASDLFARVMMMMRMKYLLAINAVYSNHHNEDAV